jgi:hypothetical protein
MSAWMASAPGTRARSSAIIAAAPSTPVTRSPRADEPRGDRLPRPAAEVEHPQPRRASVHRRQKGRCLPQRQDTPELRAADDQPDLFARGRDDRRIRRRTPLFVPAEEIPDLVKQAFISAEDKNFYNPPGL